MGGRVSRIVVYTDGFDALCFDGFFIEFPKGGDDGDVDVIVVNGVEIAEIVYGERNKIFHLIPLVNKSDVVLSYDDST